MMKDIELGQGKFIRVNGIEMYYEDFGTGTPLLLLHGGLGTAAANWDAYLPTLAKEFRVIAPDCRGHGKSNNASGEWTYSLMAADIAAFIKELDLQKPFVCGWSDGGQIGLELAMRYPGLASAYILGAVWKEFTDIYLQSLQAWGLYGPGDVKIDQFQEAMSEYVDLLKSIHSPQGAEFWQELLIGTSNLWLTPANYSDDDFKNIVDSMLVVIGDRDQFIPIEDAVSMYRLIPGAELAVIPGADHSLSLFRAPEFLEVILQYLKRKETEA